MSASIFQVGTKWWIGNYIVSDAFFKLVPGQLQIVGSGGVPDDEAWGIAYRLHARTVAEQGLAPDAMAVVKSPGSVACIYIDREIEAANVQLFAAATESAAESLFVTLRGMIDDYMGTNTPTGITK